MDKNTNATAAVATSTVDTTKVIDFVAVETLAKSFDEKAAALKKERDALKETDENKAHMKQQQMYKALVEARHLRGAASVTKFLLDHDLLKDLDEASVAFLAEMRGEKKVAGGGLNIFDDYFKGIDAGSSMPLYLFLYMKADGSRLAPNTKKSAVADGLMDGSIKERMNLNQLNKKLKDDGLDGKYTVDGTNLKKIQ